MATRRGGKKKAQQPKQQQQQQIPQLQDQEDVAAATLPSSLASQQPFGTNNKSTPASPAIALAKQALLSPVVTAAKAISSAATAVLAAAPNTTNTTTKSTLPAIPEDATTAADAAHVEQQSHPQSHQQQHQTPKHQGGGAALKKPFLTATAQKLRFADALGDEEDEDRGGGDGGAGHHNDDDSTPHQDQDNTHQHSHRTAAPDNSPSEDLSLDDDPADSQQPQHASGMRDKAAAVGHKLLSSLQHMGRSIGWKGGLGLAVLVLLVPLLAAVLARQSQMLQLQAQALHTQQQQVAAQARALQDLQQQLQDASAQLPGLLHTAQDTRSSLSSLTAEQSALLDNLRSLSNLTQQLVHQVQHINGTAQAGESAWQLLAALTGTNCTAQPDHAACPPAAAHAGADADAATTPGTTIAAAATAKNTSMVLEALMQLLSQEQQQDTELLQQQQDQLAQRQAELLHSLPQTIKQQVQAAMSAQLPPLDLALADCGGHIVFTSAINSTAFHRQLGGQQHHPPQPSPAGSVNADSTSSKAVSFLQQLQRSLLTHVRLPGATTAPPPVDTDINVTAAGNNSSTAPGGDGDSSHQQHSNKHQQHLLHRVLLRPASKLLPSACVPMLVGGDNSSPAVIEIQLPQPAHIHSVTLHMPGSIADTTASDSAAGSNSSTPTWLVPQKVRLVLVNSSSCGGITAPCTHPVSSAATEGGGASADAGGVVRVHKLGVDAFVSGRAVLYAGGDSEGGVLADRVVVQMSVGGEMVGEGMMTCVGRVSVQGRPTDPASFC